MCVLIDEVESLTAARKAAVSGSEPSDAVRVVNALLTQLDQLQRFRNALILTTSNLTGAIDDAFIDRADIKQYVGPPGAIARYQILQGCLSELARVGLLALTQPLLAPLALREILPAPAPAFEQLMTLQADAAYPAPRYSMMLYAVAELAVGMSGRALRKLPFLAHALFAPSASGAAGALTVDAYLLALKRAVEHELAARGHMAGGEGSG